MKLKENITRSSHFLPEGMGWTVWAWPLGASCGQLTDRVHHKYRNGLTSTEGQGLAGTIGNYVFSPLSRDYSETSGLPLSKPTLLYL